MERNEKVIENNQVEMIGKVVSGFQYSHEIFGEGFYVFDMEVPRLSDQFDTIPIMVSERLMDVEADFMNRWLRVNGNFRSYNRHEERKNKLVLSVFAREIENVLDEDVPEKSVNNIELMGYICKEPIYRKTPLGREIADLLLAVNRPYGKSDYIPCIAWGRNAKFASNLKVGAAIRVYGRIQSRSYIKKLQDETTENRVAYEVSVSKLEEVDEV